MNQNNKNSLVQNIGFGEKLAYGCGDAASNIIWAAMSAFLLFYYTDVVKVSAAAIGTIMLVSRFLDGVTDIIMGIIVDKTKSKYGKARPWILRMCIPFGVAAALLFSVPEASSETVKLVYIFVTYNLVNTIYTSINIPYGVLSSRMTQDQYQRSVLNIFRSIFSSIVNISISGLTLPLVNALGGTSKSWGMAFGIFGVISAILFMITFLFTKERVDDSANEDKPKEDVPVKEGLKALFKNKYWLIMTCNGALSGIAMTYLMGMNTYYAQYILDDVNIASSLMVFLGMPMLLGLFFLAPIVKRLGKRNTMIIAWSIIFISYGIVIVSPTNVLLIQIACVVRGLGFASFMGVQFAMIADTVEYGEWKSGYRTEGLVFSAQSFGGKFGTGIGGASVGWVLAAGGYIGGAATQSSSAISAIQVLYFGLPMAIAFIQILLMIPYKLDKEYEGIIEQLNSKKIMEMAE